VMSRLARAKVHLRAKLSPPADASVNGKHPADGF
jgi:hypothetical protein